MCEKMFVININEIVASEEKGEIYKIIGVCEHLKNTIEWFSYRYDEYGLLVLMFNRISLDNVRVVEETFKEVSIDIMLKFE